MTAHTSSVACYYYDPVKAPLLRGAVLPALRRATGAHPGLTGHVERHWRHGPHLRVRLAGPADSVGTAAEEVAGRLRGWLAEHPSTLRIGERELLAAAVTAGRAELVPPPYTPVHPDNTVLIEPVDDAPLLALLETPEAVAGRAALLRLGTDAVAASVGRLGTAGDTGSARVWLTVAAMAAHAGRYPLGLGNGHQSFLSHLEEFMLHSDPRGELRARFARLWQRHADEVTDTVARVAAGTAADRVETAWLAWTDSARRHAEPLYDRGALPAVPGSAYRHRARELGDPATEVRWDPGRRTEYSAYHRLLQQIDFSRVSFQREFVVYRFATNVLYLLLGICDVTPVERNLAAFLVSRAAERLTGVTWQERLGGYLATQAGAATGPVARAVDGMAGGARAAATGPAVAS